LAFELSHRPTIFYITTETRCKRRKLAGNRASIFTLRSCLDSTHKIE
jgi:hypothetical protein